MYTTPSPLNAQPTTIQRGKSVPAFRRWLERQAADARLSRHR